MKRSTLLLIVHGILFTLLIGVLSLLVYPYLAEHWSMGRPTAIAVAMGVGCVVLVLLGLYGSLMDRMGKLEDELELLEEDSLEPDPVEKRARTLEILQTRALQDKLAAKAIKYAIAAGYLVTIPISIWISVT